MKVGSTQAVKEAIKANLGISIVSERAVVSEVKSKLLKVVRVQNISFFRYFYLVWEKENFLSPVTRAFLKFLEGKKVQVSREK
jgi:DNA-binding transcriptional LysR family regulator